MLRCVHTDKNLVVRLGTTWLCDIKRVVVVWTVWVAYAVRHFMLCDQDHELPNVGPLQKKFVLHNGLTKMLCTIWRNLNIFLSFFTLQSRQIYKKNRGCVDVTSTTTFCMTTTCFMSHNLVVQNFMTKLLSEWTHLCHNGIARPEMVASPNPALLWGVIFVTLLLSIIIDTFQWIIDIINNLSIFLGMVPFNYKNFCKSSIPNFAKNIQHWGKILRDFNISLISRFCNDIHMARANRRYLPAQMFNLAALWKICKYWNLNSNVLFLILVFEKRSEKSYTKSENRFWDIDNIPQ